VQIFFLIRGYVKSDQLSAARQYISTVHMSLTTLADYINAHASPRRHWLLRVSFKAVLQYSLSMGAHENMV